jgi:hypothetical protein
MKQEHSPQTQRAQDDAEIARFQIDRQLLLDRTSVYGAFPRSADKNLWQQVLEEVHRSFAALSSRLTSLRMTVKREMHGWRFVARAPELLPQRVSHAIIPLTGVCAPYRNRVFGLRLSVPGFECRIPCRERASFCLICVPRIVSSTFGWSVGCW